MAGKAETDGDRKWKRLRGPDGRRPLLLARPDLLSPLRSGRPIPTKHVREGDLAYPGSRIRLRLLYRPFRSPDDTNCNLSVVRSGFVTVRETIERRPCDRN